MIIITITKTMLKRTNETQYVKMSEAFRKIYLQKIYFTKIKYILRKASFVLTY